VKQKIGWRYLDEMDGGSIVARALNDFEIIISEHTSPRRDRFTIAHELGHLFLHLRMVHEDQPVAVMRATRAVDESDDAQMRAEWEANWFAAQLLMPREEFREVIAQKDVRYAAEYFNVSVAAAKVREQSII
jgi:Zn-dependent peptidase ImmA (M78 family)